jgi:hypothetical protein
MHPVARVSGFYTYWLYVRNINYKMSTQVILGTKPSASDILVTITKSFLYFPLFLVILPLIPIEVIYSVL